MNRIPLVVFLLASLVLNGRWLDRSTLDSLLSDVERMAGGDGPAAGLGSDAPDTVRFVEAGGVRLHYLDFGGEGLPVVFVHSEAWDAHTYEDFAPRFTDSNRVLAVTRPGYGDSEPHPDGFGVPAQARSLVDFLDALGIERAVFAGNASATAELTFLGEHHPDRVAGLVYFTGMAVPWVEEHDVDPTRAFEMFRRASPGDLTTAERVRARQRYRPEFVAGTDRPTIPVPTLAFVARSGTMGNERAIGALALVGSPLMAGVREQLPPSPVREHLERLANDEEFRAQQLEAIRDPEAREYFLRLAADPDLQADVQRYHEEHVFPAVVEGQERFRRAFEGGLRLVRLDVPQVVGYEYRDEPDLLEPHIRTFLEDLRPKQGVGDTVSVAAPTGERETDRASILAALEQVEPGGTIAFRPGTYLVGGINLDVAVPGITLLGHPDGTTLRGCDPEVFEDHEVAMFACNALGLSGGQQTVRGLTFEYAWHGLTVGCCLPADLEQLRSWEWNPEPTRPGGDTIEDNTFRYTPNGLRVMGRSSEPTVIRGNRFIDVYHAIGINGGGVHFLDNRIRAEQPHRVPTSTHPGDAINISPAGGAGDHTTCSDNVVGGNRIEGHTHGVRIAVHAPDTSCRQNVVAANTILVERVPFVTRWYGTPVGDEADSTVAGVPLSLVNYPLVEPETYGHPEPDRMPVIEDNVIEGNDIIGGYGLGIEVVHASRNRIVDNAIRGIRARDPFPGNVLQDEFVGWREANGSGIWISPGSDGNEVVGNTFEEIASFAAVVEGDSNRVRLQSAGDSVRDLGTGNRVTHDTVFVAAPTGEQETDRASIQVALDNVEAGGTVQFAVGTYLIGEVISVTTPHVTLLGHPEGTTLRGCDPDDMGTPEYAGANCNGLELAGGHQTVRGLTIEYAYWALHLGCCWAERAMLRAPDGTLVEGPAIYRTQGGHVVEGNTFRRSATGIRMNGDWTEPAIIRNNRFIDNWHSVSINGNRVHLLDNDFSVPEPEQVPFYEFPNDAVQVAPTLPLQGVSDTLPRGCADNIVAGNRIEGSKNGISIMVWEPGTTCRNNVIRDNTITVRRARVPSPENFAMVDDSDSTFVGTPMSLLNHPEASGQNERGQVSAIAANLIEGNRIIGAEGLGVQVLHASRNRIVNNTITGVAVRKPFPGNTMGSEPERWRDWNGSGIWISAGSDGNEIVGNSFEDIAAAAIVAEGDRNRIETRSARDAVRDLGSGNRVSRADSVQTRIIDVDGYAVRVFTAGWEHLERGQPVVVFEGGAFSTLDAWGDLPARLARETAVVAYDRAGRGRSDWDGQRPTLDHVTARLRRILEVLGAPPPYIHVGHSFGGPLGFAFASQYPDELAGLVLVDPTPPAADWRGAFDDIGVGRAGYDEFDELFSGAFEGAPESLLIELDVLSGYLSDPDASPWSPPDLSVPVAVLLAGAGYEVPPDLPSTFDLDQQHQALLLRQVANYAEWTRTVPDATMIVANNSRHCIHCWDPELVIGAIRRVLYSDVRVKLRQALAAEGVSAIEPTYDALRSRYPDSQFDESRLELLGRELVGFGESEAAIAVFELNAREYPDAVRPHESLGDAYRAAGRLDDAGDSYERASQLAEASASARLTVLRRKLEGLEREQQ